MPKQKRSRPEEQDDSGGVDHDGIAPGDGNEPSAADLLELNRHREYVPGRRYEVYVPSPFARNPGYDGPPVLRTRYFVRWEDRPGSDGGDAVERWPVFATEEEWLELRLEERLREATGELSATGNVRAEDQWLTLQEIADQVGKSARTIRRHIVERGECPFTAFGRTKKVRRSDYEEWLKKDLPVTKEIREADGYRRDDF